MAFWRFSGNLLSQRAAQSAGEIRLIIILGLSAILTALQPAAAQGNPEQPTRPRSVTGSDSDFTDRIDLAWRLQDNNNDGVGDYVCPPFVLCSATMRVYYKANADYVDCTDFDGFFDAATENFAFPFGPRAAYSYSWTGGTPGIKYRFAVEWREGFVRYCSVNVSDGGANSHDNGSVKLGESTIISASQNNAAGINVTWNDYPSQLGVGFFKLFRSQSAAARCQGGDHIYSTGNRSTLSYLDSGAGFNSTYYYTLQAIDHNGGASLCSPISVNGYRPGQGPSVSSISVNPASVVAAGTTVNLGVSATGAIPAGSVAYQWRAAGQVVGSNAPGYSFVGQANHGTKQYEVLVTHPESNFSVTRSQQITVCRADQVVSNNACACPGTLQEIGGQCTCPPGLVRVGDQCFEPTPTPTPGNSAPVITSQPAGQSVLEGDTVTFRVTASGRPDPNYQWLRNGQNPVGGNSPEYSFVAALADNGSRFKVRVSNTEGIVDSSEVTLTVRSAPRSVRPILECVMANNDGTLTAFFGHENENNAVVNIPAGSNSGGNINTVNGGTILPGTQQTIDFSPGRVRGAFGVVFPAAGSASYSLQYAGAVSIASTVTANSQSTACAPIEPRLACVKPQGAGYRARFSYSNQNPFDIIIPAGPNNRFSPAPEFRDQPIRFLSGLGQSQQFEVVSDSTANLTWILANLSAVAKSDSTPCSLPPICNAGGPYKVQQGQNQVILNASQSSDPEGAALTYAWSTTCAGATVTGTLSPLATLMLTANREKCSVTLAVSDGGSVSICNSEITFDEVDACLIDRCGVPCGDGMSCCGCVQVDNSASLLALGNNLGQLELAIKKTTRIVRHLAPKRSKSAKLAKKTSNSLSDLRLAAQSALSAVPGIMTDCTAFFVAGSNFQSALKLTSDTAKQYQVMNNKLLKQAKKDGLGVRKSSKAVIKAALNKISQAIALIPAQDEACTSP